MKTIEITIDRSGKVKVETCGFIGGECREASRALEAALGPRLAETLTPAFYQSQPADQRLEQST